MVKALERFTLNQWQVIRVLRSYFMFTQTIVKYLPAIENLNPNIELTKEDLLIESFLMTREENLEVYYAPHNEYINTEAKIIIVGITPGWSQMQTAYKKMIDELSLGVPLNQILLNTKKAASFAGSMRRNLIEMLDECGIPAIINSKSTTSLFNEKRYLLHTTSVIKYPVFYLGKNYTGHRPTIEQSEVLTYFAYKEFPKELNLISPPALVIPLGKTVEVIIKKLFNDGKLLNHVYLFGFPHPSGANGHRKKQFTIEKEKLKSVVNNWIKLRTDDV
jgi:hypothetical protein